MKDKSNWHTPLIALLTAMASFLVASTVALASISGSISGTVRDPSGAVIPNASVVAHSTETGINNTTRTDAAGFYSFPDLPVGYYEITVTATGFRQFRETGLVLNVNSALRVDAVLKVGSVRQQVSVSSTAVHVETTSTQMGEVITGSKITAVPLNGRSYTDLLALQPGVVPVSSGEYASPSPSGDLNPGNLSISGQREDSNSFMVNGGTVEERTNNGTLAIPNLDAIAEFRILTNNFNAEYGGYSGGMINVVTKSGTNAFHGDAFEFLRNTSLDSRNFYSPTVGAFRQNQFGETFGGPIKRDKAFFFADYQGTRLAQGIATGDIPVPTMAERAGDLSAIASDLTGTVSGPYFANVLSQSLGYPVTAGEPYYTSGCASTEACVFPGGVIPQKAWSSPAPHLLSYIPLPNVPGGFFSTSALNETLRDDKGGIRVDANSRAGMLSAYYFIDDYLLTNPYPSSTVPGFPASNFGRAQQLNLGDTKTFGGTKVNVARLNYVRGALVTGVPAGPPGPGLSSLGFATGAGTLGIVPLDPQLIGVPSIVFNNYTIGVVPETNHVFNNSAQVIDDFALVHGTHSMKFGGEFDYDQINELEEGFNDGQFSFSGTETGLDFADFLIGAPSTYIQGVQMPFYTRSRYYGLYSQDSWRARPNLTLNYGLRWEVSTPWYEEHNELETAVPGEQSIVFPGAPKGWLVPGDPGIPSTIAPTRYDNFAPRLGLAYSPRAEGGMARTLFGGPGRTSIRGGFGKFYMPFEDAANFFAVGDAPFGFFYENPTPPLFATPFVDLSSGTSEGQRFPITLPSFNASPSHPDSNVNWAQYEPISGSPIFFHRNQLPYGEDYMLSIERQLGANTLVSMSYVGSQGHFLLAALEANPGNQALCLSVSQPSEVVPGTPTCGPFGENGVYQPITGGIINGTRAPLGPNFGSDSYFATMANSNYSALEVSFRHTSGRLSWLAGYTWSKALDNASGFGNMYDSINPVNYQLSKGLSSFDDPQNFVVSYSYDLPFDRIFGRNRVAEGWEVSGITRFSTGLPVLTYFPGDNSLLGASGGAASSGVDTPNFTPGPLNFTNPRTGNSYFNTSLFSTEPLGHLGTANLRFFTGPGINDWDMALLKNLRLTESKSFQFRLEAFDVFNHAQFENPVGNFLASDFGFVTAANPPRIVQVAVKFFF